ncbi:MAG: hypothetical protein IPN33_03240 [Saprospiraceae bacterium]|nr:hypothetical protein [Saprospiraceae bacterium]
MDRLEEFIKANREEFDHAVPGLKVWAHLDKNLEQRRSRPLALRTYLRAAAAVLLLLVTGGIGGLYLASTFQQKQAIASVESISPELSEAAKYYDALFEQKYQQLASYPHDESIDADIAQIDQAMTELKQDLLNVPKGSEEQIIQNLIKTYQLKLQILERILDQLESVHPTQEKTNKHEIGI